MDKKAKIAIIGGSGLTGTELIKILSMHKGADIKHATSRTYRNKKISDVFKGLSCNLKFAESIGTEELKEIDVLFLCLPPQESMAYLKEVYAKFDGLVIDVGSDFRLKDKEEYKKWYGTDHVLPEILKKFVYGIPEINFNNLKKATYIANPGCYPTSVLLALYPILDKKIAIKDIIIDSKSGVSGAGRKLKEDYLFINLAENFYAYGAGGHRHTGEIEQEIEAAYGKKLKVSFTPHLLPVHKGIFSSIYCRVEKDYGFSDLYKSYYQDKKFVNIVERIPQIRDVCGTNRCNIAVTYDSRPKVLKIFSVIDNLVKGAAGQAVQNMNIALGYREEEGLNLEGLYT
ncbi:MAG: N-acetyl-gamma-glutamyl-phosphate reductase [Actinomycetota bacterium]